MRLFAGVQGTYASRSDGFGGAVVRVHAITAYDTSAGVRSLVFPRIT